MFLLGSGVSIPGGFPSTVDITEQVYKGRNIIRHTDGRYYLSDHPSDFDNSSTEPYLPPVLCLIQKTKDLMQQYEKQEFVNYEILYYLIQQLDAFESGDLLNMALYPFINEVKKSVQLPNTEIDVFGEAEKYIRHTVWRKLSRSVDTHQHLEFLSEAMKDNDVTINVATLNHDLLIETHLKQKKADFCDGFGTPENGVRYWKNRFADKNNLLKVHGSINWFNLKPDHGDWLNDKIGIVLGDDIDHAKSPTGDLMRSTPEKEPQILVGTFNKIYGYAESIFSDIYCQFRTLLSRSQYLVVSGYGFRDKGVNTTILEWLYKDREHKIIVIHPQADQLLQTDARNAISRAFTGIARNNFVFISKFIQNTSWQEIKNQVVPLLINYRKG